MKEREAEERQSKADKARTSRFGSACTRMQGASADAALLVCVHNATRDACECPQVVAVVATRTWRTR